MVTFFVGKWFCTCKHKTSIGVYSGTQCLHETFLVEKLTNQIQQEINKIETTNGKILFLLVFYLIIQIENTNETTTTENCTITPNTATEGNVFF